MTPGKIVMGHDKKIAPVAHDNKKCDLLEWAGLNRDLMAHPRVRATGTTGEILEGGRRLGSLGGLRAVRGLVLCS